MRSPNAASLHGWLIPQHSGYASAVVDRCGALPFYCSMAPPTTPRQKFPEIFVARYLSVAYTRSMTNKELLAQIDSDILKAEQDIQSLRVRLATLKEYRSKITGERRQRSNAVGVADNGLPGPGKAIRELMSEQPGLDSEALIQALKGNIKTKAANQERLLRNTIRNMMRDGVLKKDESGGLRIED